MALGDLTDRNAVLAALAEFKRLGRDDFLQKYGFGKSMRYFVLFRGQCYDSKAIAGAAHGYQFPDIGPLRSGDFFRWAQYSREEVAIPRV